MKYQFYTKEAENGKILPVVVIDGKKMSVVGFVWGYVTATEKDIGINTLTVRGYFYSDSNNELGTRVFEIDFNKKTCVEIKETEVKR